MMIVLLVGWYVVGFVGLFVILLVKFGFFFVLIIFVFKFWNQFKDYLLCSMFEKVLKLIIVGLVLVSVYIIVVVFVQNWLFIVIVIVVMGLSLVKKIYLLWVMFFGVMLGVFFLWFQINIFILLVQSLDKCYSE